MQGSTVSVPSLLIGSWRDATTTPSSFHAVNVQRNIAMRKSRARLLQAVWGRPTNEAHTNLQSRPVLGAVRPVSQTAEKPVAPRVQEAPVYDGCRVVGPTGYNRDLTGHRRVGIELSCETGTGIGTQTGIKLVGTATNSIICSPLSFTSFCYCSRCMSHVYSSIPTHAHHANVIISTRDVCA